MNKPAKISSEVELLLSVIDQAFERKSWHGTNLRGAIRGLTAEVAAWRPAPDRHNIHETVLHCAYWKYTVRRRLLGEARGSFALKGSNWFVRPVGPDISPAVFKADVDLLVATHRSMREAIAAMNPADLRRIPRGSRVTYFDLITGIAAHDLYHAGQIQLLKRLQEQ